MIKYVFYGISASIDSARATLQIIDWALWSVRTLIGVVF
jgi:hypothetical protein